MTADQWRTDPRGRVITPAGVIIGRAYVPPPQQIYSQDAQLAQAALLEPKTAIPQSPVRRLVGRVWRWL